MLLVISLIITPAYSSAGHEIASPKQIFSGTVTPDKQVYTFSHSDKWFPVRLIKKGAYLRKLSKSKNKLTNLTFEANGKIVFEYYELGIKSTTYWPSFSIAKSITSTLVGMH